MSIERFRTTSIWLCKIKVRNENLKMATYWFL